MRHAIPFAAGLGLALALNGIELTLSATILVALAICAFFVFGAWIAGMMADRFGR